MRHYNNLARTLRAVAAIAAVGAMTFAGCTKVDDTLGSNLIPDDQQMKAGYLSLGGQYFAGVSKGELNPRRYVETRLFQTDSIVSSNISYGYMGSMLNDTFGLRTAGFLSQYISYYKVDSGYFGFRPIFDSVQLLLSVGSYGKDTLTAQRYNVYEVIDNSYLTQKPIASGKTERDTVFYLGFDPVASGAVGSDVLFSFTFPDGVSTGPATTAVTMEPTTKGRAFIERLMLLQGKYAGDYSIYSVDSLEYWVDTFKGLYIVPAEEQTTAGKGNIYALSLDASGFSVYGRNRVEADPTLIKDTIGMIFYFYDSYSTEHGNVSVNTIRHDYSQAATPGFAIADAMETNPDRPLNTRVYVEGMGGVVTEISFTGEFFEELEARIAAANLSDGQDYKTMAFNQVRMSLYFEGSNYDWQNLNDAGKMIDRMNVAQSRLGLYTDYKTLTGVADYAYLYETQYDMTLAYDGYINRSQGCYVMDITAHVQELWNGYRKVVAETPAGQEVDMDKVKNRRIYLAPEAYGLYTQQYSVVQGMTPDAGELTAQDAPIRLDISYTLIK